MHQDTYDAPRRRFAYDETVLDGVIVTAGFALCRAWIVFCLSLSLASGQGGINWPFLLAGAVAAFALAFKASGENPLSERRLVTLTASCVFAACALIALSAAFDSTALFAIGIVAAGCGSGLLQICWGNQFAAHDTRFSLVCTPAAAIATGLTIAIVSPDLGALVATALPLTSLGLLILQQTRATSLGGRGQDEAGIASRQDGQDAARHETQAAQSDQAVYAARDVQDAEAAIIAPPPRPSARHAAARAWRAGCDRCGMRLMLSICAFSFVARVFDAIPLDGADPFAYLGGSGAFALVLVGTLFFIAARALAPMTNMLLAYRLSCPIMAFGLAAMGLAFDMHAVLAVMVVCIGYELFDLLSWVIFSERSREAGRDATAVFACGVGFALAGMAAGYALGEFAVAPAIESGALDMTAVVLVSVVFLFAVAFLVIPESALNVSDEGCRNEAAGASDVHAAGMGGAHAPNGIGCDERSSRANGQASHPAAYAGDCLDGSDDDARGGGISLEQACRLMADDAKLTPRESEVLVFLARGRTLPIVARDLHITKNTARSHIEKIYQKTGIHKQQDLIDSVEQRQREHTPGRA